MKKIIVILLSVLLLAGCESKKKEETKETSNVNKEIGVVKDQEVDGLKLTNTSLTTVNGKSTLITLVENNTGSDYKLEYFDIYLKDESGNVVETLLGYVETTIKNGEQKRIKSSTDKDITKVTKVEYEVKK